MSPQASAVATARAIFSPTVDDAARHLFNDRTLDRYRHTMADGVERVADRIARTDRPFTGVSPDDVAPGISGIDLNRPVVEQRLAQTGMPLTADEDSRLQDSLNTQRLWEQLVALPDIADFFAKVAGAPVSFIPLACYRIIPPGGTTQIHQDALLNPGFEMTTAWIPLMPINGDLGGLAVAVGSHRKGCMPVDELPPLDGLWRSATYEPGDVVLMHEALVHTGLPNRSRETLRLSIDVRFQNLGAPAAIVGRIAAVDAASVRIENEASTPTKPTTLSVDASTLLRSSTGQRIPLTALTTSELAVGRRVIASHRDARAVMIKPL